MPARLESSNTVGAVPPLDGSIAQAVLQWRSRNFCFSKRHLCCYTCFFILGFFLGAPAGFSVNHKGVKKMALVLALLIVGITLVSMYFFAFAPPHWRMPPFISEYGDAYDHHFLLTLTICGIIFFLAQIGLAYVVFRYREQGKQASYSHGNNKLEVLWTSATAVLFIGLVLWGQHIWARVHFQPAPEDALQVEMWGQQFVWYVRYPGPDNQFGRTKPELMKESAGHPLGLDPDDPASRDDLVMPILAVPVNRPVEVILRSKDVIHSFFVRELRLKQDAVPGLENRIHFTASQVGRFEIPCAELCGLGHHQMRSFLQVMPEAEFQQWLQDAAQ